MTAATTPRGSTTTGRLSGAVRRARIRMDAGVSPVSDVTLEEAVTVIDRGAAHELIDAIAAKNRGPGGRPASGIEYATLAVLVAIYVVIREKSTPSMAAVFAVILQRLTPDQLGRVGMTISSRDRASVTRSHHTYEREYRRFLAILDRRLKPIDPTADLPARRTNNADHRAQVAGRDLTARTRSKLADRLSTIIINRVVTGSIVEFPDEYRGDCVIDESTIRTSNVAQGVGAAPDKKRSGHPGSNIYVRSGGVVVDISTGEVKGKRVEKIGFGVGLTSVTPVPAPTATADLPTIITAIHVGPVTPGSPKAAEAALSQHRLNFDKPERRAGRGKNARWPIVVTDMAYNSANLYVEMLHHKGYAHIGRYPATWRPVKATSNPSKPHQRTGPIQAYGTAYCPAAQELVNKSPQIVSRNLDDEKTRAHDARLRALLPARMGINGRPRAAYDGNGRPTKDRKRARVYKLDLVCPAVLGNVRCHLKPESLAADPETTATMNPTWPATEYACCANSHVTVAYPEGKMKYVQWAIPPGSWEHTYYFEASRARNEGSYSFLKSPHVTGLVELNFGPRRDPLIRLTIAVAVAVANTRSLRTWQEDTEAGVVDKIPTVPQRLATLDRKLGRKAMRCPPIS